MKKKHLSVLITGFFILSFAGSVNASPITLSGLTFAEVGADIVITGGSGGAGTKLDPIVLEETVTGLDLTISIAGLPAIGNISGSWHATGFFLQKVVLNNTDETWNFFDHELQEVLGTASGEGDGLSFAQNDATVRPWSSDVFRSYSETLVPRDYINFFNGSVAPGETVSFLYAITDNSPEELFYLRQRPNFDTTPIPEPATMLLLGTGLVGVAGAARRRKKNQA